MPDQGLRVAIGCDVVRVTGVMVKTMGVEFFGRGHYYGLGSYEANVKLYDVKTHHGRRYFSWIKIAEHGHETRHLKYSDGFWHTR